MLKPLHKFAVNQAVAFLENDNLIPARIIAQYNELGIPSYLISTPAGNLMIWEADLIDLVWEADLIERITVSYKVA